MTPPLLKIGTRGSPLALAQACEVRRHLAQMSGEPEEAYELVIIRTQGDRIQDKRLSEIGGKGIFTKELETALLQNDIDVAVHSLKDMAAQDPEGLMIGAVLKREVVQDALITGPHGSEGGHMGQDSPAFETIPHLVERESLDELPHGALMGTASLRRQAQLLRLRPDLKVTLLRGNVATRIQKVRDGEIQGTLLAVAGLRRLHIPHEAVRPLPLRPFLPAVAQGAIALQVRTADSPTHTLIHPLHHEETALCVSAERAFLEAVGGSCKMPIAGYSWVEKGYLHMMAEILAPHGAEWVEHVLSGNPSSALFLGREMGYILQQKMAEQGLEV